VAETRIDDQSFALLSRLVQRLAGIHLPPHKRALLEARLGRRLRAVGAASFLDYYRRATRDPAELVQLVEAMCTHETRFFREPAHYTFLRERVIPRWQKSARAGERAPLVRAWSAACASGEEPYSLAMLLTAELEPNWRVEVLASDVSTRVLRLAQAGEWPLERAVQVPEAYRKRFLLRGTGPSSGRMRVTPQLRACLRFIRYNLHEEGAPAAQQDLVFCCNVLIYFDRPTRLAVARRLVQRLAPDGLLFLGSAEVIEPGLPVRKVAPNVYCRAESGW
jgi:chemotaxis protein methyltransferase CheR